MSLPVNRLATRRGVLAGLAGLAAVPILAACSTPAPTATPAPPPKPAAPAPTTAPAAPAAAATTAPAAAPTMAAAAPTAAAAAKPTTAPAAAATTAPAAAATTAPAAAKPSGAVVATVRMTHWWGDQFAQYNPIVEEKTGLKIEEERSPYSGYFQKLLTQLVAGAGPDVFEIDANENGDFFTSGTIQPYDDYLKTRKDVDMSKWNVPQDKENGFQGKVLGLSLFTMQDVIIHINKELAEKDGLLKDLPVWGSPSYDTWKVDKFVDWVKAGTKMKSDGTFEQFGLGTSFGGWNDYTRAYLVQNGGKVFDNEWDYNETKSEVDSPASIEAMQWIADLVLKHKVAPTLDAEKAIQGGNYRGKRAMATLCWSTPSCFPESTTFPQEHIHLPFLKNKIHAYGANYLSINKASKLQEHGFNYATTLMVDTDARKKFLQVSSVPAYDPLPIVQSSPEGNSKKIALMNLSRIKGMSTVPANAEGVIQYPRWYGFKAPGFTRDTLSAAVQSFMGGKTTVQEAMVDAKKKIDTELAKKK